VQEFDSELPEAQAIDRWLTIFRASASGIPLAGGSITELWTGFFSSPLAKRRDAWLRRLAIAVIELQRSLPDLSIESLQQNDTFISAVLSASSIAMRNHRKEKLDALRNAAISSVLHPDIDEELQTMFMRYVDELTPWHLRMLGAFHDPNAHFRTIASNVEWLVRKGNAWWSSSNDVFLFVSGAFPELQSEHQFVSQLVYDLGVRQLIPVQQLFHQKLPDVGPYTTFTGRKFMRYVGLVS
jgi:hypothetical protein